MGGSGLPPATFSSGLCGLRDWLFPPGPPRRQELAANTLLWPRGVSLVRALGLGIRAAVVEQEAINRGRDSGLVREGHGWLKVASLCISWMFSLFLWWTGRGELGPASW